MRLVGIACSDTGTLIIMQEHEKMAAGELHDDESRILSECLRAFESAQIKLTRVCSLRLISKTPLCSLRRQQQASCQHSDTQVSY